MGSYYTHGASKDDIIRERLRPVKLVDKDGLETGSMIVCVRHSLKGNCLWKVDKHFDNAGDLVQTFISLDLLKKGRYGWGYKPMDESMCPYYFNCPLSFLRECDPPNGYAIKWRDMVREYHERERIKRNLKKLCVPGATVHFKPGRRLLGPHPLETATVVTARGVKSGNIYGSYGGCVFRIMPRDIESVDPPPVQ